MPEEAIGGGTVSIAMTGKLTFSDTVPGATVEQLQSLAIDRIDLEARRAYRFQSEGSPPYLAVEPGPVDFVWDGPQHSTRWLSMSLRPDGRLQGSIGLYDSYPGDTGWRLEGKGPPVDLDQPGSVVIDVVYSQPGVDDNVGRGQITLRWALDPTVRHSWIHHYVPRRAM